MRTALAAAAIEAISTIERAMLSIPDDVGAPFGFGRSCWSVFQLLARCCVGRRRPYMVRRGAAHSAVRHSSARNGWVVQPRPSLPRCRSCLVPQSFGRSRWDAARLAFDWPCKGNRPNNALPIRWRGWRESYSGFLHLAEVGRPVVRDGSRWLCGAVGQVLARPSVQPMIYFL